MPKTPAFSDLDLSRWKEYPDLITDSLWLLGSRDNSSVHSRDYWGNFVPQIPNQLMRRFTKASEMVLDLFCGLGTTLIEARRLGRHALGVELNGEVANRARQLLAQVDNPSGCTHSILEGDSTTPETREALQQALAALGFDHAHLVLLHPPYHNIIKFSDSPADLSNCASKDDFLARFALAVEHSVALLAPGRFLGLVIGDYYAKGEWVPLGFECMQVCREAGLVLKAINVKDIQGNERGKGKNTNLWKYRALKQGFYIFKHEYVMVFRKPG